MSARYNPNQPTSTTTKISVDSIPTDLYQYPEWTPAKLDSKTLQIINPIKVTSKWRSKILRNLKILDIIKLKASLENKKGDTNVVSDGGIYNYQSNFGLVIATKSKVLVMNKGKIYSNEFHESSYRSELYGVLAAVVSVRHIFKIHQINIPRQKQVYFYCDNKSVVKTINNCLELCCTVNQHRYPDVDIEQQLMYELQQLDETNFIITFQHVRGHQGTEKKSKLTTAESLNIESDLLTHEARRLTDVKLYSQFPTNNVNFKLNNRYINSHFPKMVNLAFHSMALRDYYETKYNWMNKIIY
jgi:hypothetical protein